MIKFLNMLIYLTTFNKFYLQIKKIYNMRRQTTWLILVSYLSLVRLILSKNLVFFQSNLVNCFQNTCDGTFDKPYDSLVLYLSLNPQLDQESVVFVLIGDALEHYIMLKEILDDGSTYFDLLTLKLTTIYSCEIKPL